MSATYIDGPGYVIRTTSTDKWTGVVSYHHSDAIYRTRAEAERIAAEYPPIPRPWFSEQRRTVIEVSTAWPVEEVEWAEAAE